MSALEENDFLTEEFLEDASEIKHANFDEELSGLNNDADTLDEESGEGNFNDEPKYDDDLSGNPERSSFSKPVQHEYKKTNGQADTKNIYPTANQASAPLNSKQPSGKPQDKQSGFGSSNKSADGNTSKNKINDISRLYGQKPKPAPETKSYNLPIELQKLLQENAAAKKFFDTLHSGQKKAFCNYIAEHNALKSMRASQVLILLRNKQTSLFSKNYKPEK